MKAILLAGGAGTRLHPLTLTASKQLLPVYDKPMVYYPLSTLMMAGIRNILIISTPHDLPRFQELLGSGERLGLNLEYKVQPSPDGLAQAFTLGQEFIGNDHVALILGDNVFYGHGLSNTLQQAALRAHEGATIFGYYVRDPSRYGVVTFDDDGQVIDLIEKPTEPASNYAVPGLYFYDNDVVAIAKSLKPSPRGELEITDLNRVYLHQKRLRVQLLGRGVAWLDTGTHESLLQASNFIEAVEQRQGLKIGCLEEVAFRMGFIDRARLLSLAAPLRRSPYGAYLEHVAHEPRTVAHPN